MMWSTPYSTIWMFLMWIECPIVVFSISIFSSCQFSSFLGGRWPPQLVVWINGSNGQSWGTRCSVFSQSSLPQMFRDSSDMGGLWCLSIFDVQKWMQESFNVVKTIINHPPNHYFYRWYKPFPMCGLWHCFTNIKIFLMVIPMDWPKPVRCVGNRREAVTLLI